MKARRRIKPRDAHDNMRHLEFLVEEKSMAEFLNTLLPRLLPEGCNHVIRTFNGKRDMKKKLDNRLRGYSHRLPRSHHIIILMDRDKEDCKTLKKELDMKVRKAGLRTRSQANNAPWQVAIRIVIEELEAWYFGDWKAVMDAYPNVSPGIPLKSGYRNPDTISKASQSLHNILKKGRYFSNGMRKTEAAREIASRMNPKRNRSRSFTVFYRTIMDIAEMNSPNLP